MNIEIRLAYFIVQLRIDTINQEIAYVMAHPILDLDLTFRYILSRWNIAYPPCPCYDGKVESYSLTSVDIGIISCSGTPNHILLRPFAIFNAWSASHHSSCNGSTAYPVTLWISMCHENTAIWSGCCRGRWKILMQNNGHPPRHHIRRFS